MAYAGGMKGTVTKDLLPVVAPTGVSTARVSLTSAVVCVAILAWAITNAYLSQL
jgi:hypothetical protein